MVQGGTAAQKVVVSISRADDVQVYDVELPVDVPLGSLAALVAMALGWAEAEDGHAIAFELTVHPEGRVLSAHHTLAQEGVWDGAWLVLCPRAGLIMHQPVLTVEPITTPAPESAPSPVVRWRPLTQAARSAGERGDRP